MLSPSLTHTQAVRALYIDFEGGQNLPPSFLGIRTHKGGVDSFEQVVTEEALAPTLNLDSKTWHEWPEIYLKIHEVRRTHVAATRRADTLEGIAESLTRRAEQEDRRIISWSSHERDVILAIETLDETVKHSFSARWLDARLIAREWKRKTHPGVVFDKFSGRGRHRLHAYMQLVGYQLPSYFGDRQAAARIDYVRQQLARKKSAAALTAVANAKWTKVLDYNWHDCNGMREVTLRAAKDLHN